MDPLRATDLDFIPIFPDSIPFFEAFGGLKPDFVAVATRKRLSDRAAHVCTIRAPGIFDNYIFRLFCNGRPNGLARVRARQPPPPAGRTPATLGLQPEEGRKTGMKSVPR